LRRLGTAVIGGLLALGFLGCAGTTARPRHATKAPAAEQKRPCDASVDVHAGAPRYPFAQITTVSVRCGATDDVALRAVGAMPSTVAQWKNDRTLVITVPPGIRVLHRKPSAGQVAIETVPRLRDADLLYGPLPTNRWPSTCADGAKQVIAGLSPESVAIIRGLAPADFGQLRQFWGALLSRHFALADENLAMLDSCGGPPDISASSDLVDLIGIGLRGRSEDVDKAALALRGKRPSRPDR
jgi:hypothetical protein